MTEMKFCPVLPGSRQRYKLFINYVLLLRLKSFIQARRDPFFVLPGSRFAETQFSHIIVSASLSGMKKIIKSCLQMYNVCKSKQIPGEKLSHLAGKKFDFHI